MKNLIYAVEDDESISDLYKLAFPSSDFDVETFVTAEDMFVTLEKKQCDLLILDVTLPGMDGISALKKIRGDERYRDIPVIIISAKGDEINKVKGLDAGADDYVAKPFGVLELVARVKANLRKAPAKNEKKELSFGEITLSVSEHTVTVNGRPIVLTLKEFNLLKLLMEHIDTVIERETILNEVWGYEYFGETRTLDMHIKSLRSKISEYTDTQYIQTIRGVGYKFCKNEE